MRLNPLSAATLLVASSALASGCLGSCFGGSTWISLARGRRRLRDIRVGGGNSSERAERPRVDRQAQQVPLVRREKVGKHREEFNVRAM